MSIYPKKQNQVRHPGGGKLMTEQHHKETCDIHTIMRKYEKTGLLEHVAARGPEYKNYVGAPDFKEAMDYIANANSLFQSIPSSIRDKFNNDPAEYLNFVTDENNREAIEALGLPTEHLGEKPCDPTPTPREPTKTLQDVNDGLSAQQDAHSAS